ncbi:MAG: LLM class F420-dependent oxidoreductase [Candidatus Tectomicrobia bacterium]
MQYGFTLPGRGPYATPENLGRLVTHGEALGYDSVHTGDHILIPKHIASPYPYSDTGAFPGSASGEYLEQLTVLAFLAGQTHRIRLSTSVIIVPHRNPLVAAKTLATLDVLSQGRLIIGVGVGWMREEFEALGIPSFDERGAVTDEYLQVFKELWSSDNPTFEGKYCRFSDIDFLPKPVQKPHPPIWVGGESRRAMRRTARFGNGWYPIGSNPQFPMGAPELLKAGLERLASLCQAEGRDPAEIDIVYRSHALELGPHAATGARGPFVGNAEQIAGDIRQYEALGVTHLIVDFVRSSRSLDDALRQLEAFATQVWPQV